MGSIMEIARRSERLILTSSTLKTKKKPDENTSPLQISKENEAEEANEKTRKDEEKGENVTKEEEEEEELSRKENDELGRSGLEECASNIEEKAQEKVESAPSSIKWARELPFYVAYESKQKPILQNAFPKRVRGIACYLCGLSNGDGDLEKCGSTTCPTVYHKDCAEKSVQGGYTLKFMGRNKKVYCSLHHCTACFADHNRARCYNGKLIACNQCELAWHVDCIPGGCEFNSKNGLTCPRHVLFHDAPHLHIRHCADCQKEPEQDESLIKCTTCFRSVHFNCYKNTKLLPVEDTEEERRRATCHWCDMFDFIRYKEFAMARLSVQKWYPCQVVSNKEFPKQNDPCLAAVGYLCVKWFPYNGRVLYNLISHNRIVAMSNKDYFFVSDAHKKDYYQEWIVAQKYTLMNSPLHRPLKADQIPKMLMSNGEKVVKMINHNKYSKAELKRRVSQHDLCRCVPGAKDRCGPSSQCINRMLRMECPKECDEKPNKKCRNRRISNGDNCIQVKIEYFPGKGYGAIAQENVQKGDFVGEYVGEVIDVEEKERRMNRIAGLQSHEAQYYIMELDDRRAIDAQYYGNNMRYVNHSCSPNCVIQQIESDSDTHLVLIANQEIKKGDELSFDYNMQGRGRSVPVCRCNAKNCTGVLSADPATKKSMYDWESWTVQPAAKKRANRSISVPSPQAKKVGRPKKERSSFASSAPTNKRRQAVEVKLSADEEEEVPLKRTRTLRR